MAKFEVFIPASGAGSFDLTFRVEAENWLAALNTGMKKIGEKGGAGTNVLVDIQDDESIHVTDPKSGRVFRIKEMAAVQEATQASAPNPFAPSAPAASPFDPRPAMRTQLNLPQVSSEPSTLEQPSPFAAPEPAPQPATEPEAKLPQAEAKPAPKPHGGASQPASAPAPTRSPTQPPGPAQVRKTKSPPRRPSSIADQVVEVPQEEVKPPPGRIGREKPAAPTNIDDILADLFERTEELEGYTDPEEALYFLLDLAMEKLDAESGSVFLADLSSNELNVGAARGPKSKELLRLNPRIPQGTGIVGFCVQEAAAMAISDVHRDPRFFRAISDRLGYETRSILCAPMMVNGRTFGCLEVINKKTSSRFSEGELAIVTYLAEQGARYLDTVG